MASLSAALKAAIVASGVAGERVYQDEAPPGVTAPYVVYRDYLSDVAVLEGDGGEDLARRRVLQADLWFGSQATDSKTTVKTLRDALTGAALGATDEGKAYRVRVQMVLRRYYHDADKVQYTLDLRASYLA